MRVVGIRSNVHRPAPAMHVLNEIVAKDSRSNRRAADERLMTISLLYTESNRREAGGRHRVDM